MQGHARESRRQVSTVRILARRHKDAARTRWLRSFAARQCPGTCGAAGTVLAVRAIMLVRGAKLKWRSMVAIMALPLTFALCDADGRELSALDNVYRDESHCLVEPEIRSATDRPISCRCRDAIADMQYIRRTYLDTGRDRNLNGAYLTLWDRAQRECGDGYDVLKAEQSHWNGPEVMRKYPPDSAIERIAADGKGFRRVQYEVRLAYRDAQGQIAKVETFSASEVLPPDFKTAPCPPGAACPR
jgi:hypothetical protein